MENLGIYKLKPVIQNEEKQKYNKKIKKILRVVVHCCHLNSGQVCVFIITRIYEKCVQGCK
jgi:hypothetical protein